MDPPITGGEVDWFRYVISGVSAILTLVIRAMWRRQDGLETKIDNVSRTLGDHALEDEKVFAKKDDLREAFRLLRSDLAELKESQGKDIDRIVDRLDQLPLPRRIKP